MYLIQKHTGKFIFLAIVLSLINFRSSEAQQEPQYTQYMFNTVAVNPAYAGTRNALNILLLSRLQWSGMDGAPRTYDLTMHTPLENYKMGLGLSVISDSYGPVKNLYVNLSYSYRVNLSGKLILSMGIKGGFYYYHVNLADLYTGETATDPVFSKDIEQSFKPNAGFGIYLYTDRYYFGASAPKLFETDLNGEQTTASSIEDLKRHYFFMAGAVFNLSSEVKLKPSVITRVVEGAPFSTDAAAQFLFKDRLWAGGSYRLNDAIAILTGVQVTNQLMIGYSYDIPISDLKPFNNGSHEILISYDFDNFVKEKMSSPRYF